jgi:hypothetical protein
MAGRRHPSLGNILLYLGPVLIGDSFSKEFFKLVLAVERLALCSNACRPKNPAAFPSQRGMRISNDATTTQIEMGFDWYSSYLGQCEVEEDLEEVVDVAGGLHHRIGRDDGEGDPSLRMNAAVVWPTSLRVVRLEVYLLIIYL